MHAHMMSIMGMVGMTGGLGASHRRNRAADVVEDDARPEAALARPRHARVRKRHGGGGHAGDGRVVCGHVHLHTEVLPPHLNAGEAHPHPAR